MEPIITTIAAAVALGAGAGLKDTASKAVTDAYNGLKKLIQDRYKNDKGITFAVEHVSEEPEEESRRKMLEAALTGAGADKDTELVTAAEAVLDAVKDQPGGEEAVQQIVNQQVIGNDNIFSGSGNVTVTR
ncbi:MAG: hypothetical protein D3915_12400 [Candidatus Electrothrix sp. AU1_5]|nr:hypothetical protein [Candidatus Electrothrix gigas]